MQPVLFLQNWHMTVLYR